MGRNVTIYTDKKGREIVRINEILFKGKRNVDWHEVKRYLTQFNGTSYEIQSSSDIIFLDSKLADEFSGSSYTHKLMGAAAKAKANAAMALPELIQTAMDKHFKESRGEKHQWDARYGWYRYNAVFELPVFDSNNRISRYNVYHASLLVRHDNNGKMYLYDVIDIKKEMSNPLES